MTIEQTADTPQETPLTLAEKVAELARLRSNLACGREVIAEKRALFEASMTTLYALERDGAKIIAALEASIKAEAVAVYGLTQDKHPAPGVTVQDKTALVYDEAAALGWVKVNAPFLVVESLDRRGFDPLVKAGKVPANVARVEAAPTAVISTKLDELYTAKE